MAFRYSALFLPLLIVQSGLAASSADAQSPLNDRISNETKELLRPPIYSACERYQLENGIAWERKTKDSRFQFSDDGETMLVSRGNLHQVIERKTGKILFEPKCMDSFCYVTLSPDGQTAMATSIKGVKLFDVRTQKLLREELGVHYSESKFFSKNSASLIFLDNGSIKKLDIKTGKTQQPESKDLSESKEIELYTNLKSISSDGSVLLGTDAFEQRPVLIDTKTLKRIKKLPVTDSQVRFSNSGEFYLDRSSKRIVNTRTGHAGPIISELPYSSAAAFSSDDSLVAFSDNSAYVYVYSTETSKLVRRINKSWSDIIKMSFSPDNSTLWLLQGRFKGIDLKTGDERFSVFNAQPHPSRGAPKTNENIKILVTDDGTPYCYDALPKVVQSVSDCCGKVPLTQKPEQNNFSDSLRCKQSFSPKLWGDTDSFDSDKKGAELSDVKADEFLRRFQKPGGFELREHGAVLLSLMESQYWKKQPNLVLLALQGIFVAQPKVYKQLLTLYPELTELRPKSELKKEICRSTEEQELVLHEAEKQARNVLDYYKNQNTREKESYQTLGPLGDLYSSEFREKIADPLEDAITVRALETAELAGAPESIIVKLAGNRVRAALGAPLKKMTTLDYVRNGDSLQPMIYSSEAIDGDPKTMSEYGFAVKRPEPIRVPSAAKPGDKVAVVSYSWKTNGESYRASLDVKVSDKSFTIPNDKAPPYDKLWQDGVLTGLIITGSGLDRDYILKEYQDYFTSNGFVQEKDLGHQEVISFMEQKIGSGEIDYFIKEAHTDGDHHNLFAADKIGRIKKFFKAVPGGKKEVVYLVYPSAENKGRYERISNKNFGSWIKHPFVFFNTSCNSYYKAINEFDSAQSSDLVEIAGHGTLQTFNTSETNALKLLLDDFRSKKDYKTMRQSLGRNEDFARGQSNRYVFADDEDFDRLIRSAVKVPLDISTPVVRDSKGQEVHLVEH